MDTPIRLRPTLDQAVVISEGSAIEPGDSWKTEAMRRYKARMCLTLKGCRCHTCLPTLYEGWPPHSADKKHFSFLNGFEGQSHDPGRLAQIVAQANFQGLKAYSLLGAHKKWLDWYRQYGQAGKCSAISEEVNGMVLDELIDIFSDIFFMGQLPRSKVSCFWTAYPPAARRKYAMTQPPNAVQPKSYIFLNLNHHVLAFSVKKMIQVILHEMVHALFQQYACDFRGHSEKALELCSNLQVAALGLTGHGRAWHWVIQSIERCMPAILGFEGDLGRMDALGEELRSEACLPCQHDIKIFYPWVNEWKQRPLVLRHYIRRNRGLSRESLFNNHRTSRRHSDSDYTYRRWQGLSKATQP